MHGAELHPPSRGLASGAHLQGATLRPFGERLAEKALCLGKWEETRALLHQAAVLEVTGPSKRTPAGLLTLGHSLSRGRGRRVQAGRPSFLLRSITVGAPSPQLQGVSPAEPI